VADPASRIHGRSPEEIFDSTDGGSGPDRLLDYLVRTGPYGEGYGQDPDGLSLARLMDHPHGIDLGPLQPRLPEALCTPSGRVELAPEALTADVARLLSQIEHRANGVFSLIGRRDVRSNNSWMHNIDVLVKGRERCTLQINPDDAVRLGVVAGGRVKVSSPSGSVVAPVEITDDIMPGVVSLPHGWGHDYEDASMSIAALRPGVNSNRLATGEMDPLSGNAVLNGIPVEVVPA
jgi:anaerobic selenocysteine-containing dehydrogenase